MAKMKHLSRREFLRKSVGAGAVVGLGIPFLPWPRILTAQEDLPILAQVKGPTPEAVREAVNLLGGMGAFVHEGHRVLLKPNASFAAPPEWGATTSSAVVRTVAQMCLESGAARVTVFDHPLRSPALCLEQTGLEQAVADLSDVQVVLADKQRYFEAVDVPNGSALQKVEIAKEALRADVMINLPAAKSHSATGVSLGMKNLMGLVWDRGYFHQATDLHRAIAELSSVIHPQLIIVDASRALVTGGPGGPGRIMELQTIVAGVDPVAVDAQVVRMAPWMNRSLTADQVRHLSAAHDLGLGQIDLDRVEIKEVNLG